MGDTADPLLPDRSSVVPLWRQVGDDLRRRCAAGSFPHGVPGEVALAKEYGISRHTVREALRDLRVEGLVHSQRGRGTFVAAPDPHPDEVGVVIDADVSRRLGLPADAPLSLVERVRRRPGHAPSLERTWTPAADLGT